MRWVLLQSFFDLQERRGSVDTPKDQAAFSKVFPVNTRPVHRRWLLLFELQKENSYDAQIFPCGSRLPTEESLAFANTVKILVGTDKKLSLGRSG